MLEINLDKTGVRKLNEKLHGCNNKDDYTEFFVKNPNGKHAIAVGIDSPISIRVDGHVGYYCAGMNKQAVVNILGNAGAGVAENIMSGKIFVKGNASQYAGATGHGGLLVIHGDASSRCGISMKGVDIVVGGSVGHMAGFMAQSGNLVVCGDCGHHLGDSIYEVNIFVQGSIKSLGTDCIEKEMREEHIMKLKELLDNAKINADYSKFKRYGSARKLYNFKIDDAYLS